MKTKMVRSPYDESEIGEVPEHSDADVDAAVQAARRAVSVEQLPAWRRAEILTAASDMIGARREELAHTISREAAKPISTARTEAARALSTIGFSGLEARHLGGEVLPMEGSMMGEGKLAFTQRVPIGVVAAISPFNFPLNLVAHKVGPALAAGCPVVLKPASQTPFSALALAEILAECGLPEGWLNVVTGPGSTVGDALISHPDVAYVSFTGSADVGWQIPAKAPRKKVALELGNSTPVIIEPDGNWEQAAHSIAVAGYTHAGQSCVSVQRVYVQEQIAGDFTRLLADLVSALPVGDPSDETTAVSSMISSNERDRAHSWIKEATEQGADLLCGGEIEGSLLTPAVLANTTIDMAVQNKEIFAPVVAVQAYETLDEAVDLANGTRYGLQAGIFTDDVHTALRASRELHFGAVLINEVPTWRADIMPYGGVKDSGNTREGPRYAIESMTETRLVVMDH